MKDGPNIVGIAALVGDHARAEVLTALMADRALTAMAEIVHDIDLKDGKFAREEAGGIAHLVTGLCTANKEDDARIERGGTMLDDLYAYFSRRRG